MTGSAWSQKVRELRRAFDEAFAAPPSAGEAERDSFLILQMGGDPLALRLTEIAGLDGETSITTLPGELPGLLGLAGIEGRIVPVFSLSFYLGRGTPEECRNGGPYNEARWIARSIDGEEIGLALGEVDRCVSVSRGESAFAPEAGSADRGGLLRGTLRVGSEACRVIHVPSILAAIKKQAGAAGNIKEA